MAEIVQGLHYAKTHEWVKLDGDVATIGVSDFAQSELGDITYIELPEPGTSITQGEPLGVIESVKAASDIFAPVSGEVVETNQDAVNAPDVVNASPYDKAWLVKVRLSDPSEIDTLMDAAAYETFVAEQEGGH